MSLTKKIAFIAALVMTEAASFKNEHKKCIIMLDPAGDAHMTGRSIKDCFERGITLQCAESLKKALEKRYEHLYVIITRSAGDRIEPLQNAHFTNRIATHLFITLHFYHEKKERNNLAVYHYVNDVADYWDCPTQECFVRYDQAHKKHCNKSSRWSKQLVKELGSKSNDTHCELKGAFGIPCKALVGINCPALALEFGIKNNDDWQKYIAPLIESLHSIIAEHE